MARLPARRPPEVLDDQAGYLAATIIHYGFFPIFPLLLAPPAARPSALAPGGEPA